jgi:uncharacterized protein YdhG (YjbR/CyaY superfamily)
MQSNKHQTKAKTIDEYLASLSSGKRATLQVVRKNIHAAIPRVEECISYQMPGFRLDGKVLEWFGAASNHCAFYPGGVVDAFQDELEDYDTSKGKIRFTPDHPLPATLVRQLIKARIAAVAAKGRKPASTAKHRR